MTAMPTIKHEAGKFSADVDGGEAQLLYRKDSDGAFDIFSVRVPTEARGRGIADLLVKAALVETKKLGVLAIATCPYVKWWLAQHPEEETAFKRSSR